MFTTDRGVKLLSRFEDLEGGEGRLREENSRAAEWRG